MKLAFGPVWSIASYSAASSTVSITSGSKMRSIGSSGQSLDVVGEAGGEPALGLGQSLVHSLRVVFDLIQPDLAKLEVVSVRVSEVETAHARSRRHRAVLCEAESDGVRAKQGQEARF